MRLSTIHAMALLKLSCPYVFLVFFSKLQMSNLDLLQERKERNLRIPIRCYLLKLKAEKDGDCLSVYQSVFSFVCRSDDDTHTHTHTVRTGDSEACVIEGENAR